MFYALDKLVFNLYSKTKKAQRVNESGTFIGIRERNGRRVNLFMYKSLFVEVLYVNDDTYGEIESISLIGNISRLNSHLEKQFMKDFKRPTFSQGLSA